MGKKRKIAQDLMVFRREYRIPGTEEYFLPYFGKILSVHEKIF